MLLGIREVATPEVEKKERWSWNWGNIETYFLTYVAAHTGRNSLCVCAHRSHAAHTAVIYAVYTEHTQIQAWLRVEDNLSLSH